MRLLAQSWIDGTFVTFDCFFTQYLFASLTILAISSLLKGKDSGADYDSYQEASRLLAHLKESGNLVAQEYCHHVDVMQTTVLAYAKRTVPLQNIALGQGGSNVDPTAQVGETFPTGPAPGPIASTDFPWTEPSLQELLSHPVVDIQFLEDAVRDSQSLYWPS